MLSMAIFRVLILGFALLLLEPHADVTPSTAARTTAVEAIGKCRDTPRGDSLLPMCIASADRCLTFIESSPAFR